MRLKAGDLVVGVVILLVAAALFVLFLPSGSGGALAIITVDGQEFYRVYLENATAYTITLPGDMHIVAAVERGRVCFSHSDCPDQVCVRTGWLSRAGEAAACMPGRALIRLEGAGGADAVIG